jgi:hypothetical protein
MYDAVSDSYCYPGTTVLKNRAGLHTQAGRSDRAMVRKNHGRTPAIIQRNKIDAGYIEGTVPEMGIGGELPTDLILGAEKISLITPLISLLCEKNTIELKWIGDNIPLGENRIS